MKVYVSNILRIYKSFTYSILFIITSAAFVLLSIWLPNITFIKQYLSYDSVSIVTKVKFLISSLEAFNTNFTTLSQIATLLIAFLLALNLSLSIYYIKQKINIFQTSGLSGFGILSGIVGVGCASCGSFIITQLFGLSSVGLLSALPYKGQEFSFLAIAILMIANYLIIKKISNPEICKNNLNN